MSKYDPLRDALTAAAAKRREVVMSFQEIETVLGFPLPRSARAYDAWWRNKSPESRHSQNQSWLKAGYEIGGLDRKSNGGMVWFRRVI